VGVIKGIELDDVELSGERLTLRRWRESDIDDVVAIMRDHSMYEFLALPDPYTPEIARAFVTDLGHEGRGSGTGLGCAVVERTSGRLVGAAALRLGDAPNIGYWTAPGARGHGYAAEATRVLAAWGFGTLGLARIGLDCDVANLASARTALTAGFAFEGVARDGATAAGQPVDLARFGRVAGDPGQPLTPAFPPLPPGGLSDATIVVRATTPADAAALGALARDPDVVGWGFTGSTPEQAIWDRRARRAGLDWLVGTNAPMTIVDAATGSVAGEISLRRTGPPMVGDLGYSVAPAFRGRSYTARALRLVSAWAFDTGFVRLQLGAKAENIASQRAAERAGFVRTGTAPRSLRNPDGTFSAEARYALLSDTLNR